MSRGQKQESKKEHELRQRLVGQLVSLGEVASTETALFQQAAAAQYGLGITDMKALSILTREGSMIAGEIGKRLSLTSGAVTTLIDRLERKGIVSRQPHAMDRRKIIITVNREMLASEKNVYLSMGSAFASLLETYTTEQLEFLVKFQEDSIEITKQETGKLGKKSRL